MDIKYTLGHDLGNTEGKRASQVIIDLSPEDDPDGYIVGLLQRGRLEAFLMVYALTQELPAVEGEASAYALLTDFAYVADRCSMRLDTMRLAARDQFGLGWGTIAAAFNEKRSTTKSRVIATRTALAANGTWFDADGVHRGSVEAAEMHCRLVPTFRPGDLNDD